jgi:GT2 family glycosyltransferase/glycosyltransferase involved in cell wall biosynthesis
VTRSLSVCIASCDFVGPIRNGGIGTAYYNLALALARDGHRVTVLYALGQFCENRTIDHWVAEYRRQGVDFVALPATRVQGHSAIKMSDAVYRWLRDRSFDIVHCHEWRGLGFYTALAKRQGLCLAGTVLCVGAHSPVLWHLEGMNELADAETLEVDFMERQSVACADVLWSPSAHMLAWMRREGWTLPATVIERPYILLDLPEARGRSATPGAELVFFGRLETRKGLDVFCDALDRLVASGVTVPAVTFLGKPAAVEGVPTDAYLHRRAARWPFHWRMLSTLDRAEAMAYLRAPNRVAVLPSRIDNLPYTVLECLGAEIPFVAANTGGIPEMIREADRRRVLFDLTAGALAARLTTVITEGHDVARLRMDASAILDDWLAWHRRLPQSPARPALSMDRSRWPRVSVCITHHNRPRLLEAALASVRDQQYPDLEVVLVDDGSTQPEAIASLARLEPDFQDRGWRIIRQPNRYLGAARNAAVAAASGDFVLFMDDDNLAAPGEIETFVRAAVGGGADILTCFLDVFQGDAPTDRTRVHVWPFLGGALAPGLLRNVFGDANALVRRDALARLGGFTEEFGVGCEDWEFFARATLEGLRVEVVPEPLVHYRQSPQGMLHSTSQRANRMRALRPYLGLLPAHLRPLVHLSQREEASTGAAARPARLDHVQRAVVFGTGEAGKLAIDLATRCGWTVPWIVDNNPAMWNSTAHGLPVRPPDSLGRERVDLVIVASLAGKPAISAQLERMGLSPGADFVHFLDPVRVGRMTLQLSV